jgi:hypothetical protein
LSSSQPLNFLFASKSASRNRAALVPSPEPVVARHRGQGAGKKYFGASRREIFSTLHPWKGRS